MPIKELVSEHKRIVGELKTVPSLKKEYQTQKKELAKYKKMDGGEISAPNLKSFVEAAYKPIDKIGEYILDKELSNSVAVVYYDSKKNHAVVSIKGTDGLRDHLNNAIFAVSGITGYKLTKRFKDAEKIFNKAIEKYGAKHVSVVGYSQGSIAAVELGKDVFEVINLNPASKPGYNTVPNDNEYTIRGTKDPISALNPLKKIDKHTIMIKTSDLSLKKSHGIDILDRIGAIMVGKEFD
jgi:hypothetical protein